MSKPRPITRKATAKSNAGTRHSRAIASACLPRCLSTTPAGSWRITSSTTTPSACTAPTATPGRPRSTSVPASPPARDRLRRAACRRDHGRCPAATRLPCPQQPRCPTTRPVPPTWLYVGHQPLLLRQPGRAHLPLLQVRQVRQRPRPLGPRHRPEPLSRRPRPVPTLTDSRARAASAATQAQIPEQRGGTRRPRVDDLYNHLSSPRTLSFTR